MDGSLLFSVFVFLSAACLLVPISKLTGLGSVIGYLIAGVLIGPSVLGLISEPETILHFSEFGVVMMLFVIGLELQPQALWNMRGKLVGLGGLQVGLTLVAIAITAKFLGYPTGASIVIGMALALSSTAVSLQIMQDKNILKTTAGESGFSVLLFQDVIVIAMIAAIPFLALLGPIEGAVDANNHGHGNIHHGPQGVWLAVAIFGVFGGMILAGRILLRPVFRLIARSGVRETFTAMALLLVVGSALLMKWLGLSAALGAFIAGVVLADSDYRHQLERDIEPFKALLLGLFFISVGMSLDFVALANDPLIIAAMVMGLIILKFVILFIVGQVFQLEVSSNLLFATLLAQAGEFGFVLFQFARTEGVITDQTITIFSAVIALSMAVTPLLVLIYDTRVMPRFAVPKRTGVPPVNSSHKVLILGFGRVGQITSRLLDTQDFEMTIIDHDGDHIEFVKQFGHRVFYGDAADIDLLHIAGAAKADIVIVAIDDPEKSTRIVENVKQHFPQAQLIARARNRTHMFDLMAMKADFVERETVRAALAMGRAALTRLGIPETRAQQLSDDFLTYDFQLIQETWEHRDDMDTLIQKAVDGRAFIKRTLQADKAKKEGQLD